VYSYWPAWTTQSAPPRSHTVAQNGLIRASARGEAGSSSSKAKLALGQRHGALAQGLGEAVCERLVHDDAGQVLSASLPDYALPTAAGMVDWIVGNTVTPSPLNALSVKRIGEAGPIGVPPTIVNAVLDALSPLGIAELHPPLHAEKLWRAIHEARPSPAPTTVA